MFWRSSRFRELPGEVLHVRRKYRTVGDTGNSEETAADGKIADAGMQCSKDEERQRDATSTGSESS